MKQVWPKLFLMTFPLTTLGSLAPLTSVKAQITPDNKIIPDNSLGAESSVVNHNLTIQGMTSDRIDGGARRGGNLFHSFQEFNVGAGRGAYFSNPTGVENILTRVTGGNPSDISGRVGVLGNANLFLINPNGIVFGPNASLDLHGSFFASTASSLIFNNGFEFSATNPQAPPLLTVNIPIGLRFRDNPKSITVNGFGQPQGSPEKPTLAVDAGQTLALVGGDVSLDGGVLQAPGGLVELGGLTAAGTVDINSDHSLIFPDGVERANVSLKNPDNGNFSNVDVSGDGSGSIVINARNLDLQHSSLTADIRSSSSSPSLRAGDITVNATDAITLGQSSQIETTVSPNVTNNGSNINITTGSLLIMTDSMNVSEVNTFTSGQGNAGNVNINARDTLSFDGANPGGSANGIVSVAQQKSTGNAGNISINTEKLSLTNGAQVSSFSNAQGSAGSVTINATDSVSLDGSGSAVNNFLYSSNGMGNSGGIHITTGTLSITNGAVLNSSTNGMGNAGDVTIHAGDRVSFYNYGEILTSTNATGKGGDVSITSGDISLAKGSLITLSTGGQGNAGNAFLNTRSLSLTDVSQLISSTSGQGNAGNVTINASDRVSLANGSQLILSTAGSGNAGNAFLNTRSLSLTDGSLLTASSSNSPGKAGDIYIKATESVSLSGSSPMNGSSTQISSDTLKTATGNGGNITIDTNAFSLSDGAIVNTRTTSNGNAGNITINSKTFEAINGGELVSTSSGTTNAGKITVHATDWVSVNGSDPTFNERRSISNNLANVEANSGFFVQSSGSGRAGDIEVNAPQISLENSGTFSAESESGSGGNINLGADLLLLRRQSLISTSAGSNASAGNGGNIKINAPLIVAFPSKNNITANAYSGTGGQVTITTQGLFGIAPLSRTELARRLNTTDPSLLDLNRLPTNNITAISRQNPSLNGTVYINTSYLNPSQSLVELPKNVVDPTTQIALNPCQHGAGSTFAITGRGGIPSNPNQTLASDNVRVGLVTPASNRGTAKTTSILPSKKTTVKKAVPVQGWIFNDKGQVVLTAYDPTKTGSQRPWRTPASCAKQ